MSEHITIRGGHQGGQLPGGSHRDGDHRGSEHHDGGHRFPGEGHGPVHPTHPVHPVHPVHPGPVLWKHPHPPFPPHPHPPFPPFRPPFGEEYGSGRHPHGHGAEHGIVHHF